MKPFSKTFPYILILLVNLSINFLSVNVWGQTTDAYLKEIRINGGNVQFNFATFDHYRDGITNRTITNLSFNFNVTHSTGWEIRLRASSSSITYYGVIEDPPVDDIPLASLSISAVLTPAAIGSVDASFTPPFPGWSVIASGTGGTGHVEDSDIVTGNLELTYTLPSMLNTHEGYYLLYLEFVLVEVP